MKKFLIIVASIIALYFGFDYAYYYHGGLYLPNHGAPSYTSKAEGDQLLLDCGAGFEPFAIKGVNLEDGTFGHHPAEQAISKEDYLRWFGQIQELGANVIRVYTLGSEDFYDAFYEYNLDNPSPLYLLQGVSVDDYLMNSTYDALDPQFAEPFYRSCQKAVDAVHGRLKLHSDQKLFPVHYDKDVSPWVYGYILGTEWAHTLVAYTDNTPAQHPQYQGKYLYTENGSNFEIFLAQAGDALINYETQKYGEQKVIAFTNGAVTDPFTYPEEVAAICSKSAAVDVEHIHSTADFGPGQFASYHVYPYYPDYYSLMPEHEANTYLQYLKSLNEHHSIPVLIAEFGVPSSRGMAAMEEGLGRNQGFMNEQQQGQALVSMYEDINAAGSAGAIAFSWQDAWYKQTWNTSPSADLNTTAYWSNYQASTQNFGLLSFDPGEKESICYVDGIKTDWTTKDIVTQQDDFQLSMKYDEKFVYFLAEKDGFSLEQDKLYLPIDITPKSGSTWAENLGVHMSEPADFLIEINGKNDSRVWVQERYDTTRTVFKDKISNTIRPFSEEAPAVDSPVFNTIIYQTAQSDYYQKSHGDGPDTQIPFSAFDRHDRNQYRVVRTYETGKLLYGNANPNSEDFDSLADFCAGDGFVEIKLPWALLNFSDPSMMKVHDDYYENLGIEYILIDEIQVGIGDAAAEIQMTHFPLKRLGKDPQCHERLKESYYILQKCWKH